MNLPTQFGHRQFSPPADHEIENIETMKQMTAEEFATYWFGDPAKNGFAIPSSTNHADIAEILRAFSDHCEETEWVSVEDELPVEKNNQFSDWVLVGNGSFINRDRYCYCRNRWVTNTDATHWRPLPKPPKQ